MVSKLLIVAAAAGLLIGGTALGYAQSSTQDRAPGSVCRTGARCPAIPVHPVTPRVMRCRKRAAGPAIPALRATRPAGKGLKPPAGAAWAIATRIAIAATPASDRAHTRGTGRSRSAIPLFVWLVVWLA